MNVEIYFYILTDECGNKSWMVFSDHCQTIHIGGYAENGDYHTFDNEARYCWDWAKECGFKLEFREMEVSI